MNSRFRHGRLAVLASVILTGPLYSQSDSGSQLDPYVVVATRTPADIRTLGTAVDLITAADLSREQITTPAAALGAAPGVPSFANGAIGADISVFTRGSDSDQTLFLVDGIRLNDANTDYAVYLGGARLGATDSIEIARGPQSTLYGSEAVGGVISIQAQKGTGSPASDVDIEAGSFGTVAGTLNTQGARDEWAWSLSASGSHTSNDRPNNDFDSGDLVLRVDREIFQAVSVGATLRGFEGRFGDPGDVYTNDAYAHETEGNWLGTVFGDFRPSPDWSAHVTIGGQDRRYVSFDELPGVFAETTVVQNRRGVLDAQATYAGLPGQKVTAGVTAEDETTLDDGYGDIDQRQTLFAAFAEDEWHPVPSTFLTGGVRYDDFDTFGSSVTGRATAAWLTPDRSVKLRASYGTGFNAPSFLELFGVATGYSGNPNLKPERSRGRCGPRLVPAQGRRLAERDVVSKRLHQPDRLRLQRVSRHDGQCRPCAHGRRGTGGKAQACRGLRAACVLHLPRCQRPHGRGAPSAAPEEQRECGPLEGLRGRVERWRGNPSRGWPSGRGCADLPHRRRSRLCRL